MPENENVYFSQVPDALNLRLILRANEYRLVEFCVCLPARDDSARKASYRSKVLL